MPRPRHRLVSLPFRWFDTAIAQLATLAVVGALGVCALAAASPSSPVLTAAAVHADGIRTGTSQRADQAPVTRALSRTAPRHRTTTAAHRPNAAPAKPSTGKPHATGKHAAARPWQPTGTGMWLYQWRRSNRGNATSIVRQAEHAGLSTLYLRTGSSWDGFAGARHLRSLLGATRGTGIRVVAWDFPRLRRPVHDALRLARAAHTTGRAGLRVAAVAPDIETPAEGTYNAAWRVSLYLRTLQRHLPAGVSVLSAVPWPSRFRVGSYPYRTVAAHSDVLIPMAYWYNNPPKFVTTRSIRYLSRFHKPVAPVGQGYDGRLDVPGLRHNNLSRQVPAFFDAAHRAGARAVSVWSWQAAPRSVWNAIRRSRNMFGR